MKMHCLRNMDQLKNDSELHILIAQIHYWFYNPGASLVIEDLLSNINLLDDCRTGLIFYGSHKIVVDARMLWDDFYLNELEFKLVIFL